MKLKLVALIGVAFICVAMVGYIFGRWDAAQGNFAAFFNEHGLLFRLGTTLILILFLAIVANNIASRESQIAYSEIARFIVGGLVAIGIYYSILTFEFNVKKNKDDRRMQKSSSTFTILSAWYNTPIVDYSKAISFFERGANYQNLRNQMDGFLAWFDSNEKSAVELRRAIGGMFNYFEIIASGIREKVIDEQFVRRYYGDVFTEYYNDWIAFINKRRENAPSMYLEFTNLVENWNNLKS